MIAQAAVRAPSGGNSRPWDIRTHTDRVRIALAAEHTSLMDVAFRASAVAIGAATFNARVAAGSPAARVCGGAAAEAVWIIAQQHGMAVHPVSPVFLFAAHRHEIGTFSAPFASELLRL